MYLLEGYQQFSLLGATVNKSARGDFWHSIKAGSIEDLIKEMQEQIKFMGPGSYSDFRIISLKIPANM